jgi:hypothetical protein
MVKNDRVRHNNPLLSLGPEVGISISMYVVDLLHSWALGPLGVIIAFTIRFVIGTGIFYPSAILQLDSETKEQVAMVHIKALLTQHYKNRRRDEPGWKEKGSEVWTIL